MQFKNALLLSLLALALAFAPAQAANQDVYLAEGFNFYALTVTPADTDTIKDAATLMTNVAEIDRVFRFDPGTKSFKFRFRLGTSIMGDNFPLVAGEGYIFKATAAKNVTFIGTAAASAQANLVKGFNLVGFPTVSSVPTAKGLLTTYATQLKSVFAWNYNTRSFQFVIRLDASTLFGSDFDILPGTAFFLDVIPDAGVAVNFGTVSAPTDVLANLSGEIAGDTVVSGAPSLAPNRVLAGEFTVEAQKLDGTVVGTVQATPTATGYAYSFTNLPAYVGLKLVAKGPNNEFVSGFIGKLTGNAVKNLNKQTTALAVMIERDTSKFVPLINSSASSYAAEEDRLRTLMGNSLDTIIANIERMRKLVATTGITLADLRSGILARVEITETLAGQLAAYYADPTKRAVEAMDAYKQAIALIDSQAGRENVEYVRQALTLLNSITGTLTADEQKQVAVAKAAANRYMGDLIKKGAVNSAPARSFMGAYKSLLGTDIGTVGADADGDGAVDNPTTAADYYTNAEDAVEDFVDANPTYASDPSILATELPVESELAAIDPANAEEAAKHGDALEAQLENDPTQEIDVPGDPIDYTDCVDYQAQAQQNAGNPAGAVEEYSNLDPEKIADPVKKEKAAKVKNYGLGKAKIEMGDVESAFDYLKNAVADVAAKEGVENADYAKFEKINEALLAMAAVIEKLKAQNSAKLNDSTLSEAFKDPKQMAQKIDKKSEIYVTVVVVVVQQPTTNFGDNVIPVEQDANRILLNQGMALMSDFHFKFSTNDLAAALTALGADDGSTGALKKFKDVVTNIEGDAQALTDKVKLNLLAQAKLQIGLVDFFKFRISILKKEKNDAYRKAALKTFYEIRDRFKFLAAEIDGRIQELEAAANYVAEIQSSDFDAGKAKLDQAVKLLRVNDRAKAFPLLEEAVAKFDTAYKNAGTDATLKKEALRRWAEARFYRFFAYTDEDEKELFGKPEAVAALNFLRIKYPDLQAFVMDLQNRLTNAELFAATTEQPTQSGAQVGQESMPAVFLHALKLKMKAAELYKIGEVAGAKAAFDQAKALFDLMMTSDEQAMKDLLLDVQVKVNEVKAIAGLEIKNGFKADGPRLSNPLYWKIVAASAQKEEALMFADRFFALRAEADRKAAVDLLNRAIARFPEVPFVAELRRIIDDLTGGTTTNASAPMIGNLRMNPQVVVASELPKTVNVAVDVVDPNGKAIEKVTVSVLFQNTLVEEIACTNVSIANAPNLLPSAVHRSGAQGPRWTGVFEAKPGAQAGEYTFIVKAVNADGVGNELKTSFYIRPAAGAFAIEDVYADPADGKLKIKLTQALPADTETAQYRTRIDVLQPPPAGVSNALPVPVPGYVNLPVVRTGDLTRELALAQIFDAKFPFFGPFQIQVKIVELKQNQVLYTRAIPYFREKPVDQNADPVAAAFKAMLKVFTYAAADQTTRLAELKKLCVHNYAPGALEPGFEGIFDTLFKNVSASSMTVKNGPDPFDPNATREFLEVEYVRPDYAIVHALVVRSHTFAKNTTAGVFDRDGKLLLPPGLLGKTYSVEEWMDFPFFLVNNRWYAAFGQDESAQNETGVFLENVFINAQNVMSAFLTRPVDVSKFKVRLGIFKAPDPSRGVMVSSVVKGFEALELRPVNPVTTGTPAVTTAREFALPMQSVIPPTFPVFGQIEFSFRVIDENGAEVATYGMPFYRPLPEFLPAEVDTVRARIQALLAAVNAKNEEGLKALCALNGVTGGDLEAAVKTWFDALPTPPNVNPDMATLFLERRDVNRAAAWFETPLTLPTMAFEFVRLADGKWYWDTTPANYFNATDKPGIVDFYFGGNDDLVVRSTVGKTVVLPAEPPAVGTITSNVAIRLAILKQRADGTLAPVGAAVKPAFFYAGSGTNHEWKLPLAQAMPSTFTEYGDLILEAQLFMPDTAAEPLARVQMTYFRPYEAANHEPIREAAKRILAVLNNKTLDDAAKLAALKELCVGGDFGPQDALELPALIGAFTQQSLTLVPDDGSFGVHFPKPDFAELYGMVKISGVYRAPLPGGLWSPATGAQLLPPGAMNFTLNDWYFPLNIRFRLVNGQWLKTNDEPWAAPTVAGGSYIMEGFVDPQGALVVRTVEDPAGTPAPAYKVRVAILNPPPPGAAFFQDIPVAGYDNLEALKGATIAGNPPLQEYKIVATRLFGPNFPVYGDLVIAVRLVNEVDRQNPVTVGDLRIPYFRAYQNDAVAAPIRTFFQNYLAALQTRDLTKIAPFWSDGTVLGQIPEIERKSMEEVTAKILGMQFTVEDANQIFVNPQSPDRIEVGGMVKCDFRYKNDEWMGVFHPFTGDMILPGGPAKDPSTGNTITHTFYRAFNMLVVRLKKADGTFGWYLATKAGAVAPVTQPSIYGVYVDVADNFVVTLDRDVPVPPAPGGYKVRLELFQPPKAFSADPMPTPIAGFSGLNSPQAVQVNGNTFQVARSLVITDRLPVFGELIVQAVLTPADKLDQVISTYDLPWFRPFENLAGDVKTALETAFGNYVGALATADTDSMGARDAIQAMSAPGFQWAGGVLMIDDELRVKLNNQNFNAVDITIEPGSLMVYPISQTEAAVDALLKFTVTPAANPVDDLSKGIWVGGDQAQGLGWQLFPPIAPGTPNQVFQVPFHKFFRLNYADNKWYLAEEHAGPVTADVPAIFDVHVEQVPRLDNPAEFVDALVVNTGTADARYALKYDLMKLTNFGGFVGTQFQNVALQTAEPKRYVLRIGQVFTPNFPEFGEFEFRFKLVDIQNGDQKVAEWPFRWVRPFEVSDTLKQALVAQFRASAAAFTKPQWLAVLPENSARASLRALLADPSSVDDTIDLLGDQVPVKPLAAAWYLLHRHLDGFAMTLPTDPAEYYVEMVNANEAVVHCGNIQWSGSYKRAVGFQGLTLPNGNWLLPPGEVGQAYQEWRGGMRRFVRVPDPADPTKSIWKIRAFGFADMPAPTEPAQIPAGEIVDVHFEWDPNLNGVGDGGEKLVVGIGNPDDGYTGTPQVTVSQNGVVKTANPIPLIASGVAAMPGVKLFEIKKADLLAGLTLTEGHVDLKVVNDLADGAYREFFMPFYYSTYVPVMDHPVTRDGQSFGMQFNLKYGYAPDGKVASYLDFGGTYFPGDPAVRNRIVAVRQGTEGGYWFWPYVVEKVPGDNGYVDVAQLVVVEDDPTDATVIDVNLIRKFSDLYEADGVTLKAGLREVADVGGVFFAPIVPHGSSLESWPNGTQFIDGFYGADGNRVIGFLFDSDNDPANGPTPIPYAGNTLADNATMTYVFMNGNALVDGNTIFAKDPKTAGYSPVVQKTLVDVDAAYLPMSITTLQGVLADTTYTKTSMGMHFFGMPIMEVFEQGGTLPGGMQIMNVDGVAPVNGPVQINMALPQHAVNGVGFGWNMWQATQALFFMPVPEPGTTTPPPPKKIVENTSYGWSDGSIFFGSSELTAAGIAVNAAGALLVGDLKSDGTFNTPRSNPLPVIFGTAQIQLGAFTKINGATVAAGTLLSVLKPDGLHIEGTGFGPMVQPSMTNRVLAFIPAYNPQVTTPPTEWYSLLNNDWTGWADSRLDVQDVYWLPEDVPGALMVLPFDRIAGRPIFGTPLSTPVPVKFVSQVQSSLNLEGVKLAADGTLLTDANGAVDLTTPPPAGFFVAGQGFGDRVSAQIPERDLVFVPFNGQPPVPLFGNNLTGWTATQIGPIMVSPAAQGLGVIKIRDVLNGQMFDEDIIVRFPGGAALSASLVGLKAEGETSGRPLPGGDPALFVDHTKGATVDGTGFGPRVTTVVAPATAPVPTRFLYIVDNPDFVNAAVLTLLATNTSEGWSDTAITFPATAWNWGGTRGPSEATEGCGMFITDNPIVAGSPFNVISNIGMITFKSNVLPVREELMFHISSIAGVSNGPTAPSIFTLAGPRQITKIMTYHWNNGQGVVPGTIGFQPVDAQGADAGTIIGPFQTVGSDGQGGVPNAYWWKNFNPPLELPAGIYKIVDSDPSTWSYVPGAPQNNTVDANWGGTDGRGITHIYAVSNVPMLRRVETLDTFENNQNNPLDLTAFTAPHFIAFADRELPGPPDPVTSPTYALYWKPVDGSPMYISVNINAEMWKKDGNGTVTPDGCLAPRQQGLGELFFAPVPLPTDIALHSNHVWVNFGSGAAPSGYMINTVNGMATLNTSTTPPTPVFTFSTPFDVTTAQDPIVLTGNFPAPASPATHRLVAVYPMDGGEIVTIVNTADGSWQASGISFPKSALVPGRMGFLAIRDLAGGGDLSNPVYFNNGYTAPTYAYLFSIVNGITLSPSYDPNTMNALTLPSSGTFDVAGTFPDRSAGSATHALAFLAEGSQTPVPLFENSSTNTGWSSDAIGGIPVQTPLVGQTGWIGIVALPITGATSLAKPVKVTFGGGTNPIAWSNPTIAKVNNNTVVQGGLGDSPTSPIALDFSVVQDLRIDGTGFGTPVAAGQENLQLFFVKDANNVEGLKQNSIANGWGDLTVIAPRPMNLSGPGYLVFRTHTSPTQSDWALEVSNKVYVNVPAPVAAPVINTLGQGGNVTPVPGDGSYMPFVSTSPLTVNGMNFPPYNATATHALWFMQDGMQTPYQVLDNASATGWQPPVLTITMNMSMLANKTGTLFIADSGDHLLGRSNFVKVAFDGATPPPAFSIASINGQTEGGTITSTTCVVAGTFPPRVTSGPATHAIFITAYPNMNVVYQIDNTNAAWSATGVTFELPDKTTLPNAEYGFALMGVTNPTSPEFIQPFTMTINRP